LSTLTPRFQFFDKTIQEHKNTLPDGDPRDFIDSYLQEVNKTDDPDSSFYKDNAEKALPAIMADFFLAGSDSTSATLNWGMLYLLHYSEVQTKIQAEIDSVVGKSRLPCLSDKNSMPYTEAFTMELMRITTIVSFGVPHCATEDVMFHGYFIPKGTGILAGLYSTHHDPEVWGDPEVFRPERFLFTESGNLKVQRDNENFIPFSTGKRVCLGETFAKDQFFLFLTSLIQRFSIIPEAGKPKPSMKIKPGQAGIEPFPYSVVMKERL